MIRPLLSAVSGLAFDAAIAPGLRSFADRAVMLAPLVATLDFWPAREAIAQACEIDNLRCEIRILGRLIGADVSVLLLLAGTDRRVLRSTRARLARGDHGHP